MKERKKVLFYETPCICGRPTILHHERKIYFSNTTETWLTEHDKEYATHDWIRDGHEQCAELSEDAKK